MFAHPSLTDRLLLHSQDHMEDAFIMDALFFINTAMQTTSDGSFSHSPDMPLPESIAFKFNVSLRQMKEDIRYVYVRVPKNTLTAIERDHVKNQCPENSPITLKLLVKINTTEDSHGVYTLLSKAELRRSEIGEKRQIEFSGIREQFKDWLENQIAAPKPHDFTELRLIIGEGCYDRLTPKQLGFSTNSSAYIVMFSKSDDSDEIIIKAGLAELAAELTASRHTRSVGDGSNHIDEDLAGERINGSNTTLDSDSIAFNISRYHLYSCRRYSHTVSYCIIGYCSEACSVFFIPTLCLFPFGVGLDSAHTHMNIIATRTVFEWHASKTSLCLAIC